MKTIEVSQILVLLIFSLICGPAAAADRPPAGLADARAALAKARGGDSNAAERASELFGKLHEQDPANPVYLAYHGSCWAIRGRFASSPWDKVKLTEKGLDLIDRALGMLAPSSGQKDLGNTAEGLETRLVAGSTFLALPETFHRFEDGKTAILAALTSPVFDHAPPILRAQVQMQAALVARQEKRNPDEAKALHAVLSLQPQGPLADQAQARLAELER